MSWSHHRLYRPVALFMSWSCAKFSTAHVYWQKSVSASWNLSKIPLNWHENRSSKLVQSSIKSIRSSEKQIDRIQRCHSLAVWLAVQIGRWKELNYRFKLFHQEPLPLRKREEKTGWGKLIIKIGTIKINAHMTGFQNKEFVEQIFCQDS